MLSKKTSYFRSIMSLLLIGPIWWIGMKIFFSYTGAQKILANPELQSEKFIKVFSEIQPLPRMIDYWFMWTGMLIVGALTGIALLYINNLLHGNWISKGFKIGLLQWLIMIPWFEFYLPYNAMHEPLSLVLFETFLWFFVMQFTGMFFSLIKNYPLKNKIHQINKQK